LKQELVLKINPFPLTLVKLLSVETLSLTEISFEIVIRQK